MLRLRRSGLGCHEGEGVVGAGAWPDGCNLGIPTLNVDHPCVPVVDDGKFRADLFVTTCPWCNSPGQSWVIKDTASRRENVVGRPGTRDKTLAVGGPWCVARMRSRSRNSRNMVCLGRDNTSAKRTKNLKALGRFITKEFAEVGPMIEAPLGDSGLLIHLLKFRSTGTLGLKASLSKASWTVAEVKVQE